MINFIKVQEAIWKAMNTITNYPVLDYVEFDSINPPIIRLGNLYFDDNSVKNNEGIKAQQYINIYSTYSGKKEAIEMMDEVNRAMKTVAIDGHDVRVKQGNLRLYIDKDRTGSIFQRMDRNNNKFYHAVLVYDIYIN